MSKRGISMWVVSLIVLYFGASASFGEDNLIAWWNFDTAEDSRTVESVSGAADKIVGNFWLIEGVSGKALKLDGLTSYVVRESEKPFELPDAFTVEGWVALGAYPLNWCPMLSYCRNQKGGYLGIGDKGQVGLHLAIDDQWQELTTETKLELRKWYHIAGVLDPEKGTRIYVDGKEAASSDKGGQLTAPAAATLLIGKFAEQVKPTGGVRKDSHMVTDILFDGLIDELKVVGKALSADEIAAEYAAHKPKGKPALAKRVLPAGPEGPGPFGAYYARLKYYQGWDALWRVGGHPDVVVRFDDAAYKFVFWRGTSYIPHWVTENGIWYDNEFCETWGHGAVGCAEPMSDKQCRHSHVRIIESSDARVVVHWRYGLVDNYYNFARVDEYTGWGDWTDEVYTIYPDAVGVRKITLHSTVPAEPHEWQEGIIVMGPGQYPEAVLETEALTIANIDGQSHTYSWAERAPRRLTEPAAACIHLVNTKSKYKPFTVASPESKPRMSTYGGEIRRDVSIFPWWNHWPTSQNPSDGRYAMAADRAAHSSLTHIKWKEYSRTDNSMTKILLHGMTDKPAGELAPLARSWAYPPVLKVIEGDFAGGGYDPTERAYILNAEKGKEAPKLVLELSGSRKSPIVNPAFVVNDWGGAACSVQVDGKRMKCGEDFHFGHRQRLEGTDLVVWLKKESSAPAEIKLSPVGE